MQSERRGFSSDYSGGWMESMCLLEPSGCVWVGGGVLHVSHICVGDTLLLKN